MKIYNKLYILKTTVPNYVLEKIEEWDIGEAILLIHDLEIEDAYAFRFQQRSLEEERIDGRYNIKVSIIKESGTYYLEGYLETIDDIKARIELNNEKKTDSDRLLIKKLEDGGYTTIIRSVKDGAWSCVYNDKNDIIIEDKNGILAHQQSLQGD